MTQQLGDVLSAILQLLQSQGPKVVADGMLADIGAGVGHCLSTIQAGGHPSPFNKWTAITDCCDPSEDIVPRLRVDENIEKLAHLEPAPSSDGY